MPDQTSIHSPNSQSFIAEIRNRVQAGHSFIPMIGSGMSAPSGILMGQTFTNYLAFTMYLVLCDPADQQRAGVGTGHRWNIRTDGWPKYPTEDDVRTVKAWCYQSFAHVCKSYDFEVKSVTEGGNHLVADVIPASGIPARSATSAQMLFAMMCPMVPQVIRSSVLDNTESINKRLLDSVRGDRKNSLFWGDGQEHVTHSSQHFILEVGLRSMHDWRATLNFLSRVHIEDGLVHLVEPDPTVIDSFNLHITRDKQHNLGHKMLSHLSRPMRFRTILTTNFDRLIEEAYSRLKLPLAILPVSINGAFPDARTIQSQDSIVKLHGELLETRADFSLNDEPTDHDKKNFAALFRGDFGRAQGKRAPVHLLVIGFSGSDHRCIQMVKHTLDTNRETTVFWICHNEWDSGQVSRLFREPEYRKRLIVHECRRPDLLLFELYQNITLSLTGGGFAYEFIHRVPPERAPVEPSVVDALLARLPTTANFASDALTLSSGQNDKEHIARLNAREAVAIKLGATIATSVKSCCLAPVLPGDLMRLAVVKGKCSDRSSNRGYMCTFSVASGASHAMQEAFQQLTNSGSQCIWFELQDYADCDALAQDIMQVLSIRLGRFQLEHVSLLPCNLTSTKNYEALQEDLRQHFTSVTNYFNLVADNWVFFIYGRNVPGGCSGWHNTPWESKEDYAQLNCLLSALTDAGFKVVYAPLNEHRIERDARKSDIVSKVIRETHHALCGWPKDEPSYKQFDPAPDSPFPLTHRKFFAKGGFDKEFANGASLHPEAPENLYAYEDLINSVIKIWLIDPPQRNLRRITWPQESNAYPAYREYVRKVKQRRIRFLYAVTLFRQSRHTNAFFNEAIVSCPYKFNMSGIDNDWFREQEVQGWIDELKALRVFYHKPGGYSWIHRDVRLGLQTVLESLPAHLIDREPDFKFFLETRAKSHLNIADWYLRAFMTTGNSTPALEAMYHFYQSARYSCVARASKLTDPGEIIKYRRSIFQAAISQLIKTAMIAGRWVVFWNAGPATPKMFQRHSLDEVKKQLLNAARLLEDVSSTDDTMEHPKIVEAASKINQLSTESTPEGTESQDRTEPQDLTITSLIDEFHHRCLVLGQMIVSEGGEDTTRKWLRYSLSGKQKVLPSVLPPTPEEIEYDMTSRLVGASTPGPRKKGWRKSLSAWSEKSPFSVKGLFSALDSVEVAAGLHRSESKATTAASKKTSLADAIEKLHRDTARWRIEQIAPNEDYDRNLKELVQFLGELAYLYVKRAKVEFHGTGVHKRVRWVQVCVICARAIEICRSLPPDDGRLHDELMLLCKLHTLYGLALANLDRFWESNRHLSYASAILSKSPGEFEDAELAVIRLRRAEAYLTMATRFKEIASATHDTIEELLKPEPATTDGKAAETNRTTSKTSDNKQTSVDDTLWKKMEQFSIVQWNEYGQQFQPDQHIMHPLAFDLLRDLRLHGGDGENASEVDVAVPRLRTFQSKVEQMHVAALDDATASLDSVERLLAGRSHSSLWWGRYIVLRLRTYGDRWEKSSYTPLTFRRRISHQSEIISLLRRGMLNSPGNVYRLARLADYFLAAWDRIALPQTGPADSARSTGVAPRIEGDAALLLRDLLQQSIRQLQRSIMEGKNTGKAKEAAELEIARMAEFLLAKQKQSSTAEGGPPGEGYPESEHLVFRYFVEIAGKCMNKLAEPIDIGVEWDKAAEQIALESAHSK